MLFARAPYAEHECWYINQGAVDKEFSRYGRWKQRRKRAIKRRLAGRILQDGAKRRESLAPRRDKSADAVQDWKFAVAIVAAAYFLSGPARLSAAETPAPTESMSIGGATINVEIEPGDLTVSRTQVLEWVRRSACAVTKYTTAFRFETWM